MPYKGFNPVAFARSSSTTLARHITKVEEAFMRNYQIGALLDANGRTQYNVSGEGFDWPVQYRIHNVEGNTGETRRNFVRTNLWKTAALEFRGYQATDSMFYREFLANRGPEGIVKVYGQFVDRLTTSVKQALGVEYYVNGYAPGYETNWHGFLSLFRTNGETIDINTGDYHAAAPEDICGAPQGVYAGLEMTLGHYGGENEAGEIWPNGLADPEFDFWTPLVINYTSTSWNGSTPTWEDNWRECLRFGIINSQRNQSPDGVITNVILARDLYRRALDTTKDNERFFVTSETGLRALGFKNVFQFDGIEVSWEAAVPTGTGIGFTYNSTEMLSMDAKLLKSEGPEWDMETQSFNAVVSTLSNLKFASPRNFVQFAPLA